MNQILEITRAKAQRRQEKNFAYREVGEVRGRYRHPALLRHKHLHVQKQVAEALRLGAFAREKSLLNLGLRLSLSS